MAPRTGPRVKVISPNSGTVTTLSRSVSAASSFYSSSGGSTHVSPSTSALRSGSKPLLRRYAAASVTPPPPLQVRDINTATSYPAAQGGKNCGADPTRAAVQEREALNYHRRSNNTDSNTYNHTKHFTSFSSVTTAAVPSTADQRCPPHPSSQSIKERRADGALLDYFEEAHHNRAAYAPPVTAKLCPPSLSRSTSRTHRAAEQRAHNRSVENSCTGVDNAQGESVRNREDNEAIHRARVALEHAGGALLRRPFGSLHSVGQSHPHQSSTSQNIFVNKSASTLLDGNTSALPMRAAPTSAGARSQSSTSCCRFNDNDNSITTRNRGMRLPPTIPITGAADSESEEGEEGRDVYDNTRRGDSVNGSCKRLRSWADVTENTAALGRRRSTSKATAAAPAAVRSGQAKNVFTPTYYTSSSSSGSETVSRTGPSVCPGMFSGLSAIPLDPRLFAGMESHHDYRAHGDKASPASASSGPQNAKGKGNAHQQQQQRYCVRPLWSLIGTFKTSLSGLVAVDFYQDCLRWSQRNPKGGQQSIKVPLSQILDVFTTGVVQEDENIEERQFTVVVRTSTRPSQVVFGFATATDANHLRNVLKGR